jgi:hypothetical protein
VGRRFAGRSCPPTNRLSVTTPTPAACGRYLKPRRYDAAYGELERRWAPLVRTGIVHVHCCRGEECLLANRREGPLVTSGDDWVLGHDDHRRDSPQRLSTPNAMQRAPARARRR